MSRSQSRNSSMLILERCSQCKPRKSAEALKDRDAIKELSTNIFSFPWTGEGPCSRNKLVRQTMTTRTKHSNIPTDEIRRQIWGAFFSQIFSDVCVFLKNIRICTKSDSKRQQTRYTHVPKMIPKCSEHDPKRYENDLQTIRKRSENDPQQFNNNPKTIQKQSESDPKIIGNDPKMIRTRSERI